MGVEFFDDVYLLFLFFFFKRFEFFDIVYCERRELF